MHNAYLVACRKNSKKRSSYNQHWLIWRDVDGLVQDCNISIANEL